MDASGGPRANVWVVGEIADRVGGADAEVSLMDPDGRVVAVARGRIEPPRTTTVLSLTPPTQLAPVDMASAWSPAVRAAQKPSC